VKGASTNTCVLCVTYRDGGSAQGRVSRYVSENGSCKVRGEEGHGVGCGSMGRFGTELCVELALCVGG
jgi:hypothetical protein